MPIVGCKYNLICAPDSYHYVDSVDEETGHVWFYKEGESKHLLWKSSIYSFKRKFVRAELIVGDRIASFNMNVLINVTEVVSELGQTQVVDSRGYILDKSIGIGGEVIGDYQQQGITRRLYTPELEEYLEKKKMIHELSVALTNAAQIAKSNLLLSLSKAELTQKKELILDFINDNLKS